MWPHGIIAKVLLTAGAVAAAVFGQVDFTHTITLGSVVLGVIVIVAAGVFAIRNQQTQAAAQSALTWREEAEARQAKAERLEAELREKIGEFGVLQKTHETKMAIIAREQQEIRHGLKDELAQCRAELKVEQAKHDLSTLIERVQAMHAEAMAGMQNIQIGAVDEVTAAVNALGTKLESGQAMLAVSQNEQKALLTEIRDSLSRRAT